MSLAPALAAFPTAAITVLNPVEHIIMSLNSNPYFIGLMMLLLNLGGRFIGMEVSKEQERVFQHPWVRRALLFTVLFVATRNIIVAFFMTIIVLLLLSFLFNENSDLYLWKTSNSKSEEAFTQQSIPNNGLTPEEMEIWRRLNEKQIRLSKPVSDNKTKTEHKSISDENMYAFNMNKLNS